MDTREALEQYLGSQKEKVAQGRFNPFEAEQGAQQILETACARDGFYGPLGDRYLDGHNLYKTVAQFFFREDFIFAAVEFLVRRWEELGHLQSEEDAQHVHRAAISMELVDLYLRLRDRGAALRWALLTHADDMLHGLEGGGAGEQKLRGALGVTDVELQAFEGIAIENRGKVRDWSEPEGFAEEVLVRFVLEHPQFAHLLSQDSFISEFPLAEAYFKKLLDRVGEPVKSESCPHGITSSEKGNRLEHLASYLFLLIPGWVPLVKRQDRQATSEHDIIVRNSNQSTYTADLLGRHFLVECKNWDNKSVGSPDVGYFLLRMQLTHSKFGVIFASRGISGQESEEPQEMHARNLIRKVFHENDSVCVILDKVSLDALADGQKTFWSLLLDLIEVFQFGRHKSS